MKKLLEATLVGSVVLVGSALVSMMSVFMGHRSEQLQAMLVAQTLVSLLALLVFLAGMGVLWSVFGFAGAWRQLWRRTPQWLVFVFVLINSLVFVGELSIVMINALTEKNAPWADHVPLAAVLSGSLAYCSAYVLLDWRAETRGDQG